GGTTGGNALVNGKAQANTGATQTSGYKQGAGQDATVATDTGGGGGGWYGGKVTNNNNGGAGGGSGYIKSSLGYRTLTSGVNAGNGKAKITLTSSPKLYQDPSSAGWNGGGTGKGTGYGGGGATDIRVLKYGGIYKVGSGIYDGDNIWYGPYINA